MYHRIAEETLDPWSLAVSPKYFEDQVRWLAENRSIVSLRAFAGMYIDGTLPLDAVALTFDDGYACAAEVAAPILDAAALPATIFIPVELVERGKPFWWDELLSIVLLHSGTSLSLNGADFGIGNRTADDARWPAGKPPKTARQHGYRQIWSVLRGLRASELDRAMSELRRQCSVDASELPRPMSSEQVRALAGTRIDIGSHALTHPWLSGAESNDKAREIFESVDRCASLTGVLPATFSYPYGGHDEESEKLVAQAGFLCACTSVARAVRPGCSLFALPRIAAPNGHARQLARALNGA